MKNILDSIKGFVTGIFKDRENEDGTLTKSYIKQLAILVENNYIEITIILLVIMAEIGVRKYVNAEFSVSLKVILAFQTNFARSIILLKN